jgi:hypothetical protein
VRLHNEVHRSREAQHGFAERNIVIDNRNFEGFRHFLQLSIRRARLAQQTGPELLRTGSEALSLQKVLLPTGGRETNRQDEGSYTNAEA